jgi:hypothetical protein
LDIQIIIVIKGSSKTIFAVSGNLCHHSNSKAVAKFTPLEEVYGDNEQKTKVSKVIL